MSTSAYSQSRGSEVPYRIAVLSQIRIPFTYSDLRRPGRTEGTSRDSKSACLRELICVSHAHPAAERAQGQVLRGMTVQCVLRSTARTDAGPIAVPRKDPGRVAG
jgi:hypothetical protein